MTIQESVETGRAFFKSKRYTVAIPLLKVAVDAFPSEEIYWHELILACHYCGQFEDSATFLQQAIHHHSHSGWLWKQLGCELTEVGRFDEAIKAFDAAMRIVGCDDVLLLRYRSVLYRKMKNYEAEIETLEALSLQGEATSSELNELGVVYNRQKNYPKALQFFSLSLKIKKNEIPFYNMGIVFNNLEVRRNVDAADAFRMALLINPQYHLAKEKLDSIKTSLLVIGESAGEMSKDIVRKSEYYQFYVNPFEVFQIDISPEKEWDVISVQRAKKKLLQDIKLDDGKISRMNDFPLDKSRALLLADELDDESKRSFHCAVFQNKQLYKFLTQGEIDHFLYSDEYFPLETIELLDENPGFRTFLSKPFARQYNFLLARALKQHLFPVIEILFDGRRWVEPEDNESCFEGARKFVLDVVLEAEELNKKSLISKITALEIRSFLSKNAVIEIFNLLPLHFRDEQYRIVNSIRNIAVNVNNVHDQEDESLQILTLCNSFQFKNIELNEKIKADELTLQDNIRHKKRKKIFDELEPITAAPSLQAVYGIGFRLYGNTAFDTQTASFLSTYYFVLFFIPVFPIRRYRVSRTPDGYSFLGKKPWLLVEFNGLK